MNLTLPRIGALGVVLVLSACAGTPDPPPMAPYDARAAVAAIRAAGQAAPGELVVKPLGEPGIENLREQARLAVAGRRYEAAAAALDRALALAPDDPELLQHRAEVALLLRQPAAAQRLARQAIAIGAQVGPSCRRHWETVAQVRAIVARAGPVKVDNGVAAARRKRDACTVVSPPRY